MIIDYKLQTLRVNLRSNSKRIMQDIAERNLGNFSLNNNVGSEICYFCGVAENLTKEHVLPKWTFENCTQKFFTTDVNSTNQTYNKTTIPACRNCNNNLLGNIETYITKLFNRVNLKVTYFNLFEIDNIIRWLELIEYKFQVLEIRRKFTKAKSADYIPYLANIPISIMRESIDYSPTKAMAQIRTAQKRITTKSKNNNRNSLLVLQTKNKDFHFFHKMNEFIFLEIPEYKIALFYFYERSFEDTQTAQNEAKKIVENLY